MSFITRFAPSPTGWLHLGHALSALVVWDVARRAGGRVLLRIEDIDTARCRPEYEQGILDDLRWLGLQAEGPVWRQSQRLHIYRNVLDGLRRRGLVYPCFCTRGDIRRAATGTTFDGLLYPGTCRSLSTAEAAVRLARGEAAAWRLKLDYALEQTGDIVWHDAVSGTQRWDGEGWGDIVLARKDIATSYHLAVTVDDDAQGITDIVRGRDLFEATHIHVVLQRLLGFPTPRYHHHDLLFAGDGEKLSKRKGAASLRESFGAEADRQAIVAELVAAGASSSLFDHLGTVTTHQDD
ncbi:tRNA glutamyl-Q(34) synthetase GluQRS [Minwuia sp.]|uniref:tRNA glutamyl-Q(34) synthetase GluQRS n=1 Tax=Minwuia sp. TaxID=2493630 RepID=UPI003A8DF03D